MIRVGLFTALRIVRNKVIALNKKRLYMRRFEWSRFGVRPVCRKRSAHFQQCANLTAGAAEMAARLILYQSPELIRCADNGFLHKMDTKIDAMMTRLLRIVCLKM